MKSFFRSLLIWVSVLLLLGLAIYFLRFSMLRGVSSYLIKEDTLGKVDAAFVLSGSPMERSLEAGRVYNLNYTPTVIATGGNESSILKAYGVSLIDAALTRKALIEAGVDSSAIKMLPKGTSTFEESEEILGYATQAGYRKIMIISSQFHTRRIHQVFKKKFADNGIEVLVKGAVPLGYDPNSWWNSEEALLFVNNEYVKIVYYWLKY